MQRTRLRGRPTDMTERIRLLLGVHDTSPHDLALAHGLIAQLAPLLHAAGANIYLPVDVQLPRQPRDWSEGTPTEIESRLVHGPDTNTWGLGPTRIRDPHATIGITVRHTRRRWTVRAVFVGLPCGAMMLGTHTGDAEAVLTAIDRFFERICELVGLDAPPDLDLAERLPTMMGVRTADEALATMMNDGIDELTRIALRLSRVVH